MHPYFRLASLIMYFTIILNVGVRSITKSVDFVYKFYTDLQLKESKRNFSGTIRKQNYIR